MPSSLPSLAFLGAGSMGAAILRGVVDAGVVVDGEITATNRTASKASALAELAGVTSISLEEDRRGNIDAAARSRIVLVGVKPDMVADLLDEIAPALRPDAIVVSLAAGIPLATFVDRLAEGTAVIRAMPNTPATVGEAVTGLAAADAVSPEDRALVRTLFEAVGVVVEVPESQIDALSTISGSGPAYVYLLLEEFTRAAEAKGFGRDDARLMVEQTFAGSMALLRASGEEPRELRRRVTSPKGTTERAVAVLDDADLCGIFSRATDAALARARELAAGS